MELPGAGAGDHIDGSAAGLREFRGCGRSLHAQFLHRLQRRIDGDGERVAIGVISPSISNAFMVERLPLMGGLKATEPREPCCTSLTTSCVKPPNWRGMAPGPRVTKATMLRVASGSSSTVWESNK
jgi:hypothetical protein